MKPSLIISKDSNYQTYIEIQIPELLRVKDLGERFSFKEIQKELLEVKSAIDILLQIIEQVDFLPDAVINHTRECIISFNSIARLLKSYNVDKDNNNYLERKNLLELTKAWHNWAFSGNAVVSHPDDEIEKIKRLSDTIGMATAYVKVDQEKLLSDSRNTKNEILEIKESAQKAYNEIQNSAAEKVLENYSRDFKNKADLDFKWSIGWLILAGGASGFFIWLLIWKNIEIIPIDFSFDPQKDTLLIKQTQIITLSLFRIVFLSFCLYLIVFLFKQYSVKSHQYVMNSHRATALDSYKLFIQTLDENDGSTRNAIMMEVARAIYFTGSTGYVSEKNQVEHMPSIMELTKIINPSK